MTSPFSASFLLRLRPVLRLGGRSFSNVALGGLLLAASAFAAAPVITSPATASGNVGVPFSYQIMATSSPERYDYDLMVPSVGIAFFTGIISGTPSAEGTYSGTISATNADGTGTAPLTITIGPPIAPLPVITSPLTATAIAGQPFSYQITASNEPDSFHVDGNLPGLGIVFATGIISGTPLDLGVYSLTISATNAAGTGEATLTLTVEPAPIPKPVITSPTTATTIAGRTFRYQITADNGPTWFGADDLPYGLVFDPIIGVISGRPWFYGEYTIPLRASNLGGTGQSSLALNVVVTADTYIAWAWAHDLTGPGSAEGDDRDQDGLINLLEFALATDPFQSSSMQAPHGGFDPATRSLLLTHRRTLTAQVVWTYETSADLVTWSVCAPTVTVVRPDADGEGGAEEVRAALPVSAAEVRRFLRVSVSEP